jgi:trans-2,3-dihydro-3-hydroxyanthranilate isomerase
MWETSHPLSFAVAGYALAASIMPNLVLIAAGHLVWPASRRSPRPDLTALGDLAVAANCFAGHGSSWKTRMFYPGAGIAEDPATGSAAGPLAIHLARHGRIGFGEQIEIRQGAEVGRPSVLYATVTGQGDRIDSVEVGGSALIVAEGRFRVAPA